VVAVFLSGRPLYVTPEINAANAFIAAWQPGSEGEGVSDLLFANADGSVAYDFRGKLSFSWPRAPDQYANNVGTEPYFPLFPFGYGLTYGAPQNIGPLALAVPTRAISTPLPAGTTAADDRSVLFEGGAPAGGWSVFAGGQRVVTTASQQGLKLTRGAEGLAAEWATRVPVSLTMTGAPANFGREADRGFGLAITLRVDKAPVSNVVLAMGCGPLCGGKLDLTGTLRGLAQRGGFATINVPLACLRNAGADLSDVPTGFALTATNAFAVSILAVKVSRDGEVLTCAQVPPVEAAAAMTGPGHPAAAERGYKKEKVVSERGSRKKKAGIGHEAGKRSPVDSDRKPVRKRHR
jgi:beta-glucosidase